jgi:DNA repair protein RadA/Sms
MYCFSSSSSSSSARRCSRVRLHQSSFYNRRNDSDDNDDDDDDDAPPNIRTTPQEFLRKMQQRRENGGDEINVFARDDSKSLRPTSPNPNSNRFSPFASGKFNFDNSGIGHSVGKNIAIGPNKKDRTIYTCTNCNAEHSQWVGKCPSCQAWNTVVERRQSSSSGNRFKLPFATSTTSTSSSSLSWLDGISSTGSSTGPVRVTDVYQEMIDSSSSSSSSDGKSGSITSYEQIKIHRTQIPNDVELTNVLGGGIMPGSITLVGGDPGVGKSTLMLQMAGSVASLSVRSSIYQGIGMGPPIPSPTITANVDDNLGDQKKREDSTNNINNATGDKRGQRGGGIGPVLYISGEENAGQIASRALRLGIHDPELLLWCETDADVIAETVATAVSSYNIDNNDYYFNDDDDDSVMSTASGPSMTRPPSLVVIDSIQTMICQSAGSSSVGGITQVKECVTLFLRLAKSTGVPIIIVGHVTKNGDVAGPRTVEHMVDCVLYLEGGSLLGSGSGGGSSSTEGGGAGGGVSSLRVLRAAKNRFGSSDEVGVYEMSRDNGRLVPISDPSSFFLSTRQDSVDAEGCAISVALEGIRSMTVEVQALVPWSADRGAGRRIVDGISYSRLLLILAVLQKRYGISFHRRDVYVNVAGGMHLGSRGGSKSGSAGGGGSDLAVAVSVVSSLLGIPIRSDTAFVGEIGLLGELRPVHSLEKRIAEARRMGFARIVTPSSPNSWGGGKKNRSKDISPGPREISAGGITQLMCQNVLDAINCGLVVPLPTRRTGNGPALIKPKPIKVNNSSWDRGINDDDRHERDIINDDEDDIDGIIFE